MPTEWPVPKGAALEQAGLVVERVDRRINVGAFDPGAQRCEPLVVDPDVGLEDFERRVGDMAPIKAALQHMVIAAQDAVGVEAQHLAFPHLAVSVHDVADAAAVGPALNPGHVHVVDLDVGEALAQLVLDGAVRGARDLDLGDAGLKRASIAA